MTANLVVQVSMEPKLVAVALEHESVTARLVRAGEAFTLDRAGPHRPRRGAPLRQAGGRRRAGGRRDGDGHERPARRRGRSRAPAGAGLPSGRAVVPPRAGRRVGQPRPLHRRGGRGGRRARGEPRSSAWRTPACTTAARPAPTPPSAAGFGRRSMRRVRMPSTSSASASPIMAKSVKSRWACSRKRTRSGPSIGGMPRVRTASARCWKRTTISWGSKAAGTALSVDVGMEHMSDDMPHLTKPITVEDVAARVKEALESNDLERFAELLSPDVQWGAPGAATPACQNREPGPEVVRRRARGRAPRRHGQPCRGARQRRPGRDAPRRRRGALAGASGRARRGLRHPWFRGSGSGRRGIVPLSWSRANRSPPATTLSRRSDGPVTVWPWGGPRWRGPGVTRSSREKGTPSAL